MSITKAIKLIEDNIDDADFSGSISPVKIRTAEEILGITYPRSYKLFLEKYGAGDIAGVEIYGIIEDPSTDKPMIPNGIWLTQKLRHETKLPNSLVVVSETGYGPYYVLDVSQRDGNDECPVCTWDVGDQREKVAGNFGDFLYHILKESFQ